MGRGGAIITVLIGLIAIGLGIYMRPVVPAGWSTADGIVVNLEPQTDSEGDVSYTTVVQYTTAAGEQRTIRNDFAYSGPGGDQVGDTVTVTYNPSNPSQQRIISGPTTWIWYIPLAIGGAFVIWGVIRLLRR